MKRRPLSVVRGRSAAKPGAAPGGRVSADGADKERPQCALVSAAPFDRSLFFKLAGLLEGLGPVKASSTRVASRAANALRAGFAAREWAELRDARVLLLTATPRGIEALVAELVDNLASWQKRIVILLGSDADSRTLAGLERRGAHTASLRVLADTAEPLVLVEGHTRAVREIRKRLEGGPRVLTARRGGSGICKLAGAQVQLTLVPLLAATVELARQAGLSSEQAWVAIDAYAQFTLRSFRKTGRRGLRESRLEDEQSGLIEDMAAAGALKPAQAAFFRELLRVTSPLRAPAGAGRTVKGAAPAPNT